MTLPKYLIIGTMKGGTTILYDFINSHPRVTPAAQKELHYFSLHAAEGIGWYEEQFDPGAEITGEASPTYFHLANSSLIPASIDSALPGVRLILAVRNPVQRALSHFNHLKRINKLKCLENVSADEFFSEPFSDAIKQTTALQFYLYQVLSFSCYFRRFLTFSKIFKKRLLVILNEDLRESGQQTMDLVFDHLGLERRQDALFGTQRYLHGTDSLPVSEETKQRLAEFFAPDYHRFLEAAGFDGMRHGLADREEVPRKEQRVENTAPFDVHQGREGWLFLVGGANRVLDQYQEPPPDPGAVNRWAVRLEARQARLSAAGIRYLHVVAPNKLSVYPEFYEGPENVADSGILSRLSKAVRGSDLAECFLDPTQYFRKRKTDLQLYFKTDSHWTFVGCFVAYQLICSRLGATANRSLLERPFSQGKALLDLGSKMDPPIREKARFYELLLDSRREFANALVELKEGAGKVNDTSFHVGSHVVFANDRALNPETVVVFGDSFSEYRPHLLTGLLAETFAKVHFIWSSNVDFGYVDRVKPEIVLTQTVERFMPQVPDDRFDIESFADKRVHKLLRESSSKAAR